MSLVEMDPDVSGRDQDVPQSGIVAPDHPSTYAPRAEFVGRTYAVSAKAMSRSEFEDLLAEGYVDQADEAKSFADGAIAFANEILEQIDGE